MRKASIEDISEISRLIGLLFDMHGWGALDNEDARQKFLISAIASESSEVVVAEDAGSVIGYAVGQLKSELVESCMICHIAQIFVLDQYRRAHIGIKMLKVLEKWAVSNSVFVLTANVSASGFVEAETFFRSHHFNARTILFHKMIDMEDGF